MEVELIADKWYKLYNLVLLVANGILLASFIVVHLAPDLSKYGVTYGLNYPAAVIAAISVIYCSGIYYLLAKRMSYWLASILIGMLFLLNDANLIFASHGPAIFLYIVLWILMSLYAGVFGLSILLSVNFLTILVVLQSVSFHISKLTAHSLILLFASLISSALAYFLYWKKHYINAKTVESNRRLSQVAETLRDNQQQSEILIESIADGIIVINKERKITLINSAASTMTEWPIKEAMGIDVNLVLKMTQENGAVMPPEKNPFQLALNTQKKTEQTAKLNSKQGKQVIVNIVVSPVLMPGQEYEVSGVVGVIHDISEQRAAEKQSADFISTASHEMRTPVAAIEGYLSLAMNDKVSHVDSKAKEFLEKAYSSTRQLGKLFQDLLTSSKAEDGRLVNHPQIVEMGSYLRQLAESFQLAAQKKNLLVEFSLQSDETKETVVTGKVIQPFFYVHVDPDRLHEVITNLFDNAVKYTEQGKVTIGLAGTNERVIVSVSDTGPGIPADEIPHLFQKFYRVDNSAVRTIGGTGLGLYICKKIIDLYNGNITVESKVGEGSSFHIELPRFSTQQAEALKVAEDVKDRLSMPTI